MGAFYNSIQIKTKRRGRVLAAVAARAEKFGEQYYVGPCLDGWVGVYPGMCQLESVGEALAKELKGTVWQVEVHDDDILSYWLWSKGELADSYYSNPGYFGEDDRADEETRKGDPKVLARLVGGREQELRKLLDRRTKPAFESERLLKLQKAVGVANLLTSYEDLKRSGGLEIEGQSKFEEIPAEDVRKEREEKQRLRNQADSAWQRLKEAGLLLLHDPRIEDHAWGCALNNEFIVAWPSYTWHKVSFSAYREPWDRSEPILVGTPTHVGRIVADASGERVAMAAGTCVQVWDVGSRGWKLVANIPEKQHTIDAAISANGKLVAHASSHADELIVTNVADGKRLFACSCNVANKFAFHPSADWLVVNGTSLRLIAVKGKDHEPRLLFVGGKYVMPKEQEAEQLEMGYPQAEIDKWNRRGNEIVNVAGFSRDGRWLWCGTNEGFRVYEWANVPRTSDAEMPASTWSFTIYGDHVLAVTKQVYLFGMSQVYSVTEAADGTGVVFAGDRSVYRLDLETGQTRQLIEFTGDTTQVHGVHMSTDGKTLGVAIRTFSFGSFLRRKVTYGERWTWHVWSYPRLMESAGIQCPTPVEPD